MRIPEEAILSVRTCSLANHIPIVSYGLGSQLSLSLALYVEMYSFSRVTYSTLMFFFDSLKHNRSRWYDYLQSLPNDLVDLPLFWEREIEKKGANDAYDCAEALLWLAGTEAAKILDSKTECGSSILVGASPFAYQLS